MTEKLQREIFKVVTEKAKDYPVTINDLEEKLDYSNSAINQAIRKLVSKGLLKEKRVARPKGGVTFYTTPEKEWSRNLGKTCSECQNKGKTAKCIFYEELASHGIIVDLEKTEVKLTKNTYACEKFIQRKIRWKKKRLEEFLKESREITETEQGLVISYHCLNEKCKAPLTTLGEGFIAKLGSSVVRCEQCESFYKIIYDKKKEVFIVHYNEEKGIEYKRNFAKITQEHEPEKLYMSEELGIVIYDLRDCKINFRTRTILVNNWVGKLRDIKYLVTKKIDDYVQLKELLEEKGYEKIQVIQGADKLVSPPPTEQQIGILRLLRESKIVNKEFCIAMLRSRMTVIEKIHEIFKNEKKILVEQALKRIKTRIEELQQKAWVTAGEWNTIEMRAGKEMWRVIAAYLRKIEIDYIGRGKGRLVEDISMPRRRFYGYTIIDTAINAVYGMGGEFVKRYYLEIEFCWDGLPGICHEKTKGGVFGFYLDMREPEKIMVLPYLLKAIKEGRMELEKIPYYRGRNRQKIYYIKKETEQEEQLREVVEEMLQGETNGRRAKNVIRNYYLEGKQWINEIQRSSNYYEVKHHGVEYQPWAIMKEGIWEQLGRKEKEEVIEHLRKEHRKIAFKPLTIMEMT